MFISVGRFQAGDRRERVSYRRPSECQAAPWEAQAFAMTLALHERGLFTCFEWAAALAAEIQQAQAASDPDDGSTYYQHWLSAIDRLVVEKDVIATAHLHERRAAWGRAAHATQHEQPILLENDPKH
jgi:nitrile hydratase accessory protein